jgi:cytochrome c556
LKITPILLPALVLVLLVACHSQIPEEPSPFKPEASLQEIMQSIIDPNIDAVWNAVATVSTAEGIDEKRPQRDEDWQAVRQHALTVLEASNLLVMEGRAVAKPGAQTSSGGAELSTPDIQHLIDANRQAFVTRAHGLHDAVQQVIAAIDKKDVEAFEQADGLVEQACEQCHSQFWYPGDQRPQ